MKNALWAYAKRPNPPDFMAQIQGRFAGRSSDNLQGIQDVLRGRFFFWGRVPTDFSVSHLMDAGFQFFNQVSELCRKAESRHDLVHELLEALINAFSPFAVSDRYVLALELLKAQMKLSASNANPEVMKVLRKFHLLIDAHVYL